MEQIRARMGPDFVKNLEKVIEGTPEGRARLEGMNQMIARFSAAVEDKKQQQKAASEAA